MDSEELDVIEGSEGSQAAKVEDMEESSCTVQEEEACSEDDEVSDAQE